MNSKFTIAALIAAIAGAIGLGASAAYENHQVNKKVNKSMEDLKNATIKDISESLLREAVSEAANMSVDRYIRTDNESLMSKAKTSLDSRINTLVNSRYDAVTEDVSARLAEQVAKLDDPERIRKAVHKRAEDMLVSRFDRDLDDLRRDAKASLEDVNDRYEHRLEEALEDFEDKLQEQVDLNADKISSMKKVFDSIEDAFTRKRGDRDNKEIRFILG